MLWCCVLVIVSLLSTAADATGFFFRRPGYYHAPLLHFKKKKGLHHRTLALHRGGGGGTSTGSAAAGSLPKPSVTPDDKPPKTKPKKNTQADKPKKKKKKKKKTKPSKDTPKEKKGSTKEEAETDDVAATSETSLGEQKKKIEEVLQEDAASALGDAIRDRADQLLSSPPTENDNDRRRSRNQNPVLDQIDQTVHSVGWALGASDRFASLMAKQQQQQSSSLNDTTTTAVNDETGGVEASTTAVLVHYFMKSHGGAHAVQCLCSLLATLTGIGAMVVPLVAAAATSTTTPQQQSTAAAAAAAATTTVLSPAALSLTRRCLIFAMMKHVSGLMAAATVVARAIPEVGLRNAKRWIRELVQDPVSQYVFYTACVLHWLPAATTTTTTSATTASRWWQQVPLVPAILVGPVVLREWINTVFVISDVLVLWLCTNQHDESKTATSKTIQSLLKVFQSVMNAAMSVVVTPSVWRSADAVQRQAILAKLTSRISVVLELMVGTILTTDAILLLTAALYKPATERPPVALMVKTTLLAHLYLQFLWSRRRKISKLATQVVRGGAAKFPLYVLDVLLDPMAAMGLTTTTLPSSSGRRDNGDKETAGDDGDDAEVNSEQRRRLTWKEWVLTGLGLDNDAASSSSRKQR